MSLDVLDGTPASNHDPADVTIIRDATCTACGCVCDDIDLTVQSQQIIAAERACPLGIPWFLNHTTENRPACSIQGQPATLEDGIERAAQMLASAKYPLVYGLTETTSESQRAAVGIADWIGGCLDTATSVYHGPSGMAFQGVGEVTCSLGEVRNRGDLIVFWGTDPVENQPRHLSKYSLFPQGLFVPKGRADRTCVVVDVRKTKTADEADVFLQIKPNCDFEALWILRALAMGIEIDPATTVAETGQPLSVWQDLVERMKAAKFGVIFYGLGVTMSRGKHANGEAILALTRDLNKYTRFVCRANRGRGNGAGADNVVTWRTGYPYGVNLSRGYPRFNPGEYTAADLLARKEADAALVVASDPLTHLPPPACEHLRSIPLIAIGAKSTPTLQAATVAFAVATYGINIPGTVYRMDDVPISLRSALASPLPSDLEILTRLEERVKQLKAVTFA
jgi:formylmethanofuran dehydrogenase subunit B